MPTVEFHALNISAKPHPPGIYRALFERFANKRVNYYGDKVAALSKPSDTKDGIFYGLLITWTEIDKRAPMIDTVLLEKPDPSKLSELKIPDNLGFNAQIFYYAFRESDHTLVLKTRNMDNIKIGPASVERIFRLIFADKDIAEAKLPEPRPQIVEVDLFLQNDAVDRIFAIKNLHYVEIVVSTPNDDDNTEEADAIIDRLRKIGASKETVRYHSEDPKVGMRPDDVMKTQGAAAMRHGYVHGVGDDGRKRVSLNSKAYPKSERQYIEQDATVADTLIHVAKTLFRRSSQTKAN